ncbi:MAG: acyl-CoA thioester hydrolase [Gaiellaceae bacterium]|jgi:acyl-CoA thioester hydrolase|nr:acyl-CoA thioester hydrolase [Gaiellaceae bacterium]
MDGFPFVHRDNVRFRDVDAFGHVNNAVYATYLEDARNAYLFELGLVRSIADIRMILARQEIDFRSQVDVGEAIEVGVRPTRFGTKSFDLEYEIHAAGRLAATAKSVIVAFDYDANASIPIPDDWRRTLAA